MARLALPAGVDLAALGPHVLRGLEGTDEIAAVVAEGVSSPPDPTRSPYPGLASFARDNADLFFGREDVVARCLDLFRAEGFVAVVGASGSGKSSVVLAGISPRFTEAVVVRPGVHPGQALLTAGSPGKRLGGSRRRPARRTGHPVSRPRGAGVLRRHGRCSSRADWSSPCVPTCTASSVPSPTLAERLASSQVLLGPLTEADLLRAVQEPARRCGLDVEEGLAEVIAAELGEAPGALPLLGHALREAWLRREGRTITVAGYRSSGGVRSAIATTAEQALAALDDDAQAVARRVLLRMVALRPEGDDTRRWASRHEIADVDPQRTRDVIAALTESRLLVVDQDHVTVAHEALLRAWPRLNGWIVEERADLIALQELREASERWATGGHDDTDLYRGLRLDTALDLTRREGLSGLEREFVEVGRQLRDREHTEARRRTRRLRILAAVTSVFAVIAITVGVVALVQRSDAQQARTEADAAAAVAEEQRLEAQDALLTASARDLADDELDLALLLAVQARRRSDGADALDALANVLRAQPAIEKFSHLGTAASAGLDVGVDGRRGAMLDGDRLVRFTLPDLSEEPPLTIAGATSMAMSPTSSQIAVTTADGVTVVNAATGAIDARLPSLSPSGLGPEGVIWMGPSQLGVQHKQGLRHYMSVVDIETGFASEAAPTLVSANGPVASDESGRRLAIGPSPPSGPMDIPPVATVRVVDTATALARHFEIPPGQVTDFSFQPGGDLLAVGTADAGLYVLDTVTGDIVISRVTAVGESGRFSPDGTKLVIRDDAGTVTVIEPRTGTVVLPPVIQARELRNVFFTPDADALVADAVSALVTIRLDGRQPLASAPFGEPGDIAGPVSSDGQVAWAVRLPDYELPASEENALRSVAYDPDDGRSTLTIPGWALLSGPGDDWIYTWQDDASDSVIDARSGATLFTGSVLPYGRTVLTDLRTSMIVRATLERQYLDVRPLPDLAPVETRLGPFPWDTLSFVLTTDGRRIALATVEADRTTIMVRILDLASGDELIEPIRWPNEGVTPMAITFSADDRTLLIGDQEGGISEIDVETGTFSPSRFEAMRGPVVGLGTLPDGRLLAISNDGTMSMYDTTSGQPLGPPMIWAPRVDPFLGDPTIPDVALHHVLAPDQQGLRVWNIDPSTWPDVACQRAGRNLTPDEWSQYLPADEPYQPTCPQFPAE